LFPFFRCSSHTVQSLGHSFPALCRTRVGLNDVLLGPHPSLPSLRRRLPLFVRLVHRYCSAVRLLHCVHVRRSAFHLPGPVSIVVGPRRSGGLPVLVHVVSQRARVLRLRGAEASLAIWRDPSCCLPLTETGSALRSSVFRSSIARPTDTLVYASAGVSRRPPQDSGPRWIRSLLSCRTLSFLTTRRFIPALPRKRRSV
jgi:hypothetical protein